MKRIVVAIFTLAVLAGGAVAGEEGACPCGAEKAAVLPDAVIRDAVEVEAVGVEGFALGSWRELPPEVKHQILDRLREQLDPEQMKKVLEALVAGPGDRSSDRVSESAMPPVVRWRVIAPGGADGAMIHRWPILSGQARGMGGSAVAGARPHPKENADGAETALVRAMTELTREISALRREMRGHAAAGERAAPVAKAVRVGKAAPAGKVAPAEKAAPAAKAVPAPRFVLEAEAGKDGDQPRVKIIKANGGSVTGSRLVVLPPGVSFGAGTSAPVDEMKQEIESLKRQVAALSKRLDELAGTEGGPESR